MKVISKDGKIYKVFKYLVSAEQEENIWCNDWYGRHVIGRDCEWYNEKIIDLCEKYLKYGYRGLFDDQGEFQKEEFRKDCILEINKI